MSLQNHTVNIHVNGDSYVVFKVRRPNGYNIDFSITKCPTGNCQLTSIGYANSLLGNMAGDKNALPQKDVVRAVLFEAYRLIGYTPKIIFVDVNQCYIKEMVHCFNPDEIIMKNEYKSSNGSDMCVFMLNMWKG